MIFVITIVILIIYALIARSIYEQRVIELNKITILHELSKEDGPTFLFFSDMHGVSFGENNVKLLNIIDKINPDAILIGGDMVNNKKKELLPDSKTRTSVVSFLNSLTSKYPVYYCFGNHETKLRNDSKQIVEFNNYLYQIKNDNMHLINNKHEYVTYKGTRFCIYGLEIDKAFYKKFKEASPNEAQMNSYLGESPEHKHSIPIVLSHNPDCFDACAKWGAEYVLSGHNHGGYIRLPFIGGVIASNYKLFPSYSAGVYKHKDFRSTMLLTKGLGAHTIKFRLFNKPELMVLTFQSKGNTK